MSKNIGIKNYRSVRTKEKTEVRRSVTTDEEHKKLMSSRGEMSRVAGGKMRRVGGSCVGMHSVGFYHGNGAALFAKAPHSTLAVESHGAC